MRETDIAAMRSIGRRVKLLGQTERQAGGLSVSVFPHALPAGDLLAGIGGADNYVQVEAENLGTVGFFGPGAGRLPTAHAMASGRGCRSRHGSMTSAASVRPL